MLRRFLARGTLFLAMGTLGVALTGWQPARAQESSDAGRSPYTADFSSTETKGVGLRFIRQGTPYYVEAYARAFPKQTAQREGDTYSFSAPGVSIEYTDLGGVVKEDITLRRKPSFSSVTFDVGWHPDLTLRSEDGGYTWLDPDGNIVFSIPRPTVRDAKGMGGDISLVIDEPERTATLSVDADYLERANYPVVIDPSFSGDGGLLPGRSVATIGSRGLRLYRGSTVPGSRCPDTDLNKTCFTARKTDGSWIDGSTVLSSGKAYDLTMSTDAVAYVAGADAANTNVVVWKGTRSGDTWTWQTPKVVGPRTGWPDITLTTTPLGGGQRIYLTYQGLDGASVKKRVAYSDDGGTNWTHVTISSDTTPGMQVVADDLTAGGVWVYYRDAATSPNSTIKRRHMDGSTLGSVASIVTGNITSFEAVENVETVQTSHLVYQRVESGLYKIRSCDDDGSGTFTCGSLINGDVQQYSAKRTFSVGADRGRVAVGFVPASGGNALQGVYKVRYDGAWSVGKVFASSQPTDVRVAEGGLGNSVETYYRVADDILATPLDLPAVVTGLAKTRATVSKTSPCDLTTFTSASFEETTNPNWSMQIKDGSTTIRTLTGSGSALSQSWEGDDPSNNPRSRTTWRRATTRSSRSPTAKGSPSRVRSRSGSTRRRPA